MVDTMVGGVNFGLTEEQEMLQKMARDFTAKEITLVAAEYDEEEKFPREIFDKAREIGLVNMNVPEEYGGMGASLMDEVVVAEELGYGCTGISTSMSTNGLGNLPIVLAGNDKQKQYWLGERLVDNGELVSYCVTEPGAGSNVVGIKTRAEKKNGSYIINGSKTFITNASYANFYTVFAWTNPKRDMVGCHASSLTAKHPALVSARNLRNWGNAHQIQPKSHLKMSKFQQRISSVKKVWASSLP